MSNKDIFISGFFVGAIFIFIIFFSVLEFSNSTYKDGYVDCKSGKVVYELIEHEDKTKTWERIK